MEISEFEWDDNNIEHIATHQVFPDEVEDVAFDDEPWIRRGKKGTRYMLGFTIGGRYLFVAYVLKSNGIARVITSIGLGSNRPKIYSQRAQFSVQMCPFHANALRQLAHFAIAQHQLLLQVGALKLFARFAQWQRK